MSNFQEKISSDRPTLVDAYATWCGPCQHMHPIIEEVKEQVGDEANVIKVDVDENREWAEEQGITSIPTLMLFQDGELVWRQVGMMSTADIVNVINQYTKKK